MTSTLAVFGVNHQTTGASGYHIKNFVIFVGVYNIVPVGFCECVKRGPGVAGK